MLITLDEAKVWLRVDQNDDDPIITEMIHAVPVYIESATGLTETEQEREPLCKTAAQFLIRLWYDGDLVTDRHERTLAALMKSIKLKAATKT